MKLRFTDATLLEMIQSRLEEPKTPGKNLLDFKLKTETLKVFELESGTTLRTATILKLGYLQWYGLQVNVLEPSDARADVSSQLLLVKTL